MGWPATGEECTHALRHTVCSRLVERGVPIALYNLVNGISCLEANRQPSLLLDVVA